MPSISVNNPALFTTQVSVTQNIHKFNYTSEDIRLQYQARAVTYAGYSTILSYVLLATSAITYLMGHDSIGLSNSVQLSFLYYAGNPPATVDQQAWGSNGSPAVMAIN